MPFTEDLAPFFNVAEFATAATLDTNPVNGIFDKGYIEAIGNAVEGYAPTFLYAADDAPAAAQGQTLIIGGETYKVRGVEPDGTGTVLLRLERQ